MRRPLVPAIARSARVRRIVTGRTTTPCAIFVQIKYTRPANEVCGSECRTLHVGVLNDKFSIKMRVTRVETDLWCDRRRRKCRTEGAAAQSPAASSGIILIKGLVTLEHI